MANDHRGLCADRRLRDRGAGFARRLDRLAVLAALRFRCLLRGAARHARPRPLADRAARRTNRVSRHYRQDTLILETRFETDEGAVTLIDFMPLRNDTSDFMRLVVGESRPRDDVHGAGAALRLRRDRALGHAPARPDAARHRRPRHGGAANAGRAPRRELQDRRRVHRHGRRDGAVRADLLRPRICRRRSAIDPREALADDRDNSGATGRRSANHDGPFDETWSCAR